MNGQADQTTAAAEQPKPEPFRIGEYVEILEGIYRGKRVSVYGTATRAGDIEVQLIHPMWLGRKKIKRVVIRTAALRRLTCVP